MLKKGWWVLPLVTTSLLILDQLTKSAVVSSLALYEAWTPVPSLAAFFEIRHVTNTGAAFGLFQNGSNLFVIVSFIVSAIIIYYYSRLPDGKWPLRFSLAMQLAGAVGNLIDRLRWGYVVDFLDFHFWPVFNVADSCIVCGVVLLGGILFYEERCAAQAAHVHETKSCPPAD